MTDRNPDLQFETATYTADATAEPDQKTTASCGTCGKPVGGEYWQWLGRILCRECKGGVAALGAFAAMPSTFLRTALAAFGTAFACGVGYAVFVGITHTRFALVVIGIAYLVARVIRKATKNVSGRRYQVLAVALTYMAGAMGYAPDLWKELTSASEHAPASGGPRTPGASKAGAAHEAAPDPQAAPAPDAPRPSLLGLPKAVAILFALVLATPFLVLTQSPIGVIIIGIGLWEAWRRTRPLPTEVAGPYATASPSAPGLPSPQAGAPAAT